MDHNHEGAGIWRKKKFRVYNDLLLSDLSKRDLYIKSEKDSDFMAFLKNGVHRLFVSFEVAWYCEAWTLCLWVWPQKFCTDQRFVGMAEQITG